MDKFERIAVIDNELQAEFVDATLSDRKIPHGMISYHDSAYDGIFQGPLGWGHVEAPPEFRQEILRILDDAKRMEKKEVAPTALPTSERRFPTGHFWMGVLAGGLVASLGWWGYVHRNDNGVWKQRDEKGKIRVWHYVKRGMTTRMEEDRNGDGRADQFYDYESGKCVAAESDDNFDGTIDRWMTYSNDFYSVDKWDDNYDGESDGEGICVHGVLSKSWADTDFNGIYDVAISYENGRPLHLEVRPNGTNITFRRETYKDGVLKEELMDEDMDGKFDIRKVFDPMGREISVTRLGSNELTTSER